MHAYTKIFAIAALFVTVQYALFQYEIITTALLLMLSAYVYVTYRPLPLRTLAACVCGAYMLEIVFSSHGVWVYPGNYIFSGTPLWLIPAWAIWLMLFAMIGSAHKKTK
jgi:hypothetical protein